MFEFVPLQLLDNFLADYNLGHALLVAFVASVLGSVALSRKLLSLNVVVFGLVFLLAPSAVSSLGFKMFGVALLVIGPILYTTARS